MKTTRPVWPVAFAMIGIVTAALFSPASAQQTTVRVSVIPILDMVNFFVALEEGYFKDEGLDVTTQTNQQGGAVGIPGMVAGAYDVAYSNTPTILLAIQQGIDLRIIAGASKNPLKPPEQVGLVGRKEDKLRNGKDLEGKSIAVNARNGVQWLFSRAWVKATGGDPDRVTYREVPFPQMLDALKSKQVDAILAIDPFLTFGQRDPSLEVIGWPFNVVLPGIQAAAYVVTAETAAKRPELVAKFVRGLKRGADWANANTLKEPYLKIVNSYTKMDPALIASMPVAPADTEVDLNSLNKIATLMRENGLLTSNIDVANKVLKAP
jgi:NitT/TauT family transport system substrate-binding protein